MKTDVSHPTHRNLPEKTSHRDPGSHHYHSHQSLYLNQHRHHSLQATTLMGTN
ncbi:MAG: hypothetical protein IJV27_01245 [Prevotella sp.]|nr:hypothetical protein [Prevotella sp.]